MTRSSLENLATTSNLRTVWYEFWRNARRQESSGVDNETPGNFNQYLERNLYALRKQIIAGYKFSPLVAHAIPKPDGKRDRIVCVPTVRDRIVQRAVGKHLSDRAKRLGIENDASFGFIRSSSKSPRGVAAARDRAVSLRREHGWAYKSDITSFFDRIPRHDLFELIKRTLRTPSLEKLLCAAIECEIDESNPYVKRKVRKAGILPGHGVRQGMPLSPLFANIILKEFDRKLLSREFQLVRYADDFIVLADSESQCHEVDKLARGVLGNLGFEIPKIGNDDSKTSISAPDEPVEFLGLSLTPTKKGYSLLVTKHQLDNIARNLHLLKDLKQLQKQKIDITNLLRTLENKIGGYRSAYSSRVVANSDELDEILEKARATVLHEIFCDIFGRDSVSQLNRNQKRFLGLESNT